MGLFSSVPFTYEQNKMATEVWLYSSFAGAACCALVLLMIGILFLHSESRAQLDRVSFRLLTCSLLANMAFCIASGSIGLVNEDYWGCGASVMLIVLTLHISTFLLFCIALNLYLVIAHKANGHSVEQWYYICSVCIALMLSLPPFLANQYGWDEIIGGCWYSNRRDMAERIRWQVATQLFWSIACSFGEFVGFVTVFMHMLNHHLAFSRAVVPNRGDLHYTVTYRGVIIRIALYPFASLILNCITVACDIHGTVTSNSHSAATANTYRVRLLNDFCYGGRGIVYAALSISDPSLVRAVRTLYKVYSQKRLRLKGPRPPMPKLALVDPKEGTQLSIQITREAESRLDDGSRRSHVVTKPEETLSVGRHTQHGQESGLLATETSRVGDGGIFIDLVPASLEAGAGSRPTRSDAAVDRFSRQI